MWSNGTGHASVNENIQIQRSNSTGYKTMLLGS